MAETKPDERNTTDDLALLVKQMRDAQSRYFRTRTQQNLQEARDLERHVDAAVKKILRPDTTPLWDKI